jgi:hypothetical protein
VKNMKLFSVLSAALIVIIFCFVRFILIQDENTNNGVAEESSEDEASKNVLTSKMGPRGDPKLVLDADEIANLTIDYNSKIPIEAIINNEPGYEKYYEEMIQSIETLSEEEKNFPFYHEEGYYISKAPIYYFDARENIINSEVQIILFSKDFEKQAKVIWFLDNNNEMLINVSFSFANIKILRDSPDEQYIFLYNLDDLLLDSNNKLYNWTRFPIEVKGDYYHSLNYETMGISYTKLTDASNLVWIDLSNK